jgi:acetyl esterase/lipase
MRRLFGIAAIVIGLIIAFGGGYLVSRASVPHTPYAVPRVALSGVVAVPAFNLPPSNLMSDEAKTLIRIRAAMPAMSPPRGDESIADARAHTTFLTGPLVSAIERTYPTDVSEEQIGGVRVRVFTPKGGQADPERVLINLHGGAFSICWETCSIMESAPIASVGGYRVVSVNYRMAPEARHPAAVEDVAKVYRALLQTYQPDKIGIYGCSAGGALTAQAASWFQSHNLPEPGAIGIFGAGGVRFISGDSAYLAAYIDGSFPPPAQQGETRSDSTHGYFQGADGSDAIISPALHPDVLRHFPPTMLITGTRAMDMSPAIYTNSQLIKAGVPTTMIVGEGMGHCYMYLSHLPEARDAYDAIAAFFRRNLN